MEIPSSLHQTLLFDLIQMPCGFAFLSNKCMLSRGKWRKPSSRIHCSFIEQGLRPRPMHKPSEISFNERKEPILEKSQIKKSPSGLCSQIEKLVLCSRYFEALELFEFLELQNGYVSSSTYDALVLHWSEIKKWRQEGVPLHGY